MTLYDAFGFAAFLSNVWGNIELTRKNPRGWWIRIISIILWGAYGFTEMSWPVMANAATFFCINCYGLWKWKKEEKQCRT